MRFCAAAARLESMKRHKSLHGTRPRTRLFAAIAALGMLSATSLWSATLAVGGLRCEYRVNPVGLDVASPRLSWTLVSDERGQKQTAYRVLAASAPDILSRDEGDLWDSSRVDSDRAVHVAYDGKPLCSRLCVWWKVQVWDRTGRPSGWSPTATWTMGLIEKADWQARWIADPVSVTNLLLSGPRNGYHSQLATNASTTKWIAVDLGQPVEFDAIALFPARPYDWQPDTPGFLFPLRWRLEAAQEADFSDARLLLDRTGLDEPNPGVGPMIVRFPAATARHVRLTATRLRERGAGQHGLALAEFEVLRGRENLAARASVTALDSIETGAWAKANLTDGATVTLKPGEVPGALPATLVRKSFQIEGAVKRATAYATACGLYELRLNGGRVGDQLLMPEWTSYRKRIQYQVFDVTDLLRPGPNALAAALAEGWYAGRLMAVGRNAYGSHPRFLLQLEIELADGRAQRIVTDESWRSTTDGPIRSAGIYDGEVCDARKESDGWDESGFNDSDWRPVRAFGLGDAKLVWQRNEPIRVVRELHPIAQTEPRPKVHVFDLGQNMVGWCRIAVRGSAGQAITIRHAEMLNDDGTLYTANLRGAPQIDCYIPRADGDLIYEPRFTYHGFRYVELTGLDEPPARGAVLGRVFHSTSPETGGFECSDSSLNQLMRNIVWTQRANLMSSPNDCPQRDERFGWMGDIQAFSQTAIFNMDLAAFLTKFAQDIRDDQADDGRYPDFAPHPGDPNLTFSGVPAWGDAGTVVPWRVFENYADTRFLEQHFESACRWVDWIRGQNPDLIWTKGRHNDYNDWLNGDWIRQENWPSKGGAVPKEVFATAFFAHSTEIVSRMAAQIDRPDQARRYHELFEQIRAAFNRRFVRPDGHIEGGTQAGYALALNFDLLPESLRPQAAQNLVDEIRRYQVHLSTGIQTTHRAMLELSRHGHADLGWQLLTNRTFPSWLYMIDNGATTVWERWDGYVKGRGFQDAGMNSFNHWALGAVGEWIWRHVAGLNPDTARPGWKHFLIAPRPGGGVTWARGHYDSIRGRIASHWTIENGHFRLQVTVPPNTTATIRVPTSDASKITESGQSARPSRLDEGAALFEAGSGTYSFVSPF